jgi:hypothetical protein
MLGTGGAASDISGPGSHDNAAILRQIVIYASVGNRTGVEILRARFLAEGGSAQTIDDAIAWIRPHGSSPLHIPGGKPRPSGILHDEG